MPTELETKALGRELTLKHFGVKGMKWGVRKDNSGGAPAKKKGPSTDAQKAQAAQEKAKKHGQASLSNAEMKHLVNRMNLEQQYSTIAAQNRTLTQKGLHFAKDLVVDTGKEVLKTQVKKTAQYYAGQALEEYVGVPAGKKGKKDKD